MELGPKRLDTDLSLEEVILRRGVPKRDCRGCPKFEANPGGYAFGWCRSHEQYVKLYHPAGQWHSQCQFKYLRMSRSIAPAKSDASAATNGRAKEAGAVRPAPTPPSAREKGLTPA